MCHLYPPWKVPGTHFIGGSVDPRTSLDMRKWRKIPAPLTPRIKPGPSRLRPSTFPLELPGPTIVKNSFMGQTKLLIHYLQFIVHYGILFVILLRFVFIMKYWFMKRKVKKTYNGVQRKKNQNISHTINCFLFTFERH